MFVVATGMVCPIGLSAESACAAKRAGISAFKDLKVEQKGEPVIGAFVPGLDPKQSRDARVIQLLTKSLANLFQKCPTAATNQVPLLVGLAESGRPGGCAELAGTIIGRIQKALGITFHSRHSRALTLGHTSGFEALKVARSLLQGESSTCIVAAVDSLLNLKTLRWLDRDFRLKTPDNRDGLIPGEAAAAVLLQRKANPDTVTEVIGIGFGKEKAHILSDEPLKGLGLAEATRQALTEAKVGLHEIDCRLSDVTGETYGFKELPLVTGKLMRVRRTQDQPVWHWAEAIGDCGAAAGIAQMVLADESFRKDYAPGDRMIGWTSSVGGDRAAVVLRRYPSQ